MASAEYMDTASIDNGFHSNGEGGLDNSAYAEIEFFAAVNKNDLETVDTMLKSGKARVNKFNIMHKAPIYFAIQNENVAMVKLFISYNADLSLQSYCNVYYNYETPIVTAARIQNMELVELLLEHNCALEGSKISGRTSEYKSALQWAAEYGNMTMAELLYSHGADVNWIGPHFYTALHYATKKGQNAMVIWLMDRGARITIDGDGQTALHTAAQDGNFLIVKYLLERGCRIDCSDCFSFTPFSRACLAGHLEIVRYMFENYSDKSNVDLSDGLRCAAEYGFSRLMAYLIEKGADVNAKNSLGKAAISIAAHGRGGKKEHYDAVELLIHNGAYLNVVELSGDTPLTMALLREQYDIAALLIKHGAKLDAINENADSPLHIAFTTSNPLLVKYLILAGCHFCRQPWFNGEATAQRIKEVDFRTPGPARCRGEGDISIAHWEWISTCMNKPRKLQQLARRSLRQHISNDVTHGASVMPVIQALPLPSVIKKYLTMALEDELYL